MNYYYITGTSRGIGRALAERLLEDPENHITGIARGEGPAHPRYEHRRLDLSDPSQVAQFAFRPRPDARRIVLVNNAAAIAVAPVGKLSADAILRGYSVNLIAPALLINAFIAAYQGSEAEKIIVNIAAGAGRNPTDGLSTMGASKAGLDMLSRVIAAEQARRRDRRFYVVSVSPGVVDTAMADVIAGSSPEDSSRVETFQALKREGKLASPHAVADGLARMLQRVETVSDVLVNVQDFA